MAQHNMVRKCWSLHLLLGLANVCLNNAATNVMRREKKNIWVVARARVSAAREMNDAVWPGQATQTMLSAPNSVWKAGFEVHYDPMASHAYWWKKNYAGWEDDTFRVFSHFAKDKVVLDVGAWVGVTALWLGHVASRVVALEPTTKAFGEFSANLATNPDLKDKVVAVNVALDARDRIASMTNQGESMDKIVSLIEVQTKTISTLVKEHPELDDTGFVKIDTEGYERVIVPALEVFFKEKKPTAFVSLHQKFIGHAKVQTVVDKLKDIFPYMYEADMKTPFDTHRSSYTYGDHGGADVLCTWAPIST